MKSEKRLSTMIAWLVDCPIASLVVELAIQSMAFCFHQVALLWLYKISVLVSQGAKEVCLRSKVGNLRVPAPVSPIQPHVNFIDQGRLSHPYPDFSASRLKTQKRNKPFGSE